MDWIAILVICGIAALAGALLYLPFLSGSEYVQRNPELL